MQYPFSVFIRNRKPLLLLIENSVREIAIKFSGQSGYFKGLCISNIKNVADYFIELNCATR